MSKEQLKQQIKQVFAAEKDGNGENPDAQIDRIANGIANAVDAYVVSELNRLKIFLITPGAYTGTGTGVVTINAAGINGYTPGT